VRIDLNADVGEWTGDDPSRATDAALLALVTSANVACGAHAGDAESIAATVALAASNGLAIGAHPGYPDREGLGRRRMDLTPDALRATLSQQIEALADACATHGVALAHVKAHGALYNAAAGDPRLAHVIARAAREVDDRLALFGPPGSALLEAAREAGLRGVAEGFADRRYEPDGSLRPRSMAEAVLPDPGSIALQAYHLAVEHRVPTGPDAAWVAMAVETICLHGDTPDVVEGARRIRVAMADAGVEVRRWVDP